MSQKGAAGRGTHEGEDEPGREVDTKSAARLGSGDTVGTEDTEPRDEESGVRPPESTVRCKGSSTEGVTGSELYIGKRPAVSVPLLRLLKIESLSRCSPPTCRP